jgi:hypothetical protein
VAEFAVLKDKEEGGRKARGVEDLASRYARCGLRGPGPGRQLGTAVKSSAPSLGARCSMKTSFAATKSNLALFHELAHRFVTMRVENSFSRPMSRMDRAVGRALEGGVGETGLKVGAAVALCWVATVHKHQIRRAVVRSIKVRLFL